MGGVSALLGGGVCSRGVCFQGGVGGVCSGGCLLLGGCLLPGGLLWGGVCSWGVSARGGHWYPSMHWGRHPPPCGQNSWHTLVKTLPWPNFAAAGKKRKMTYIKEKFRCCAVWMGLDSVITLAVRELGQGLILCRNFSHWVKLRPGLDTWNHRNTWNSFRIWKWVCNPVLSAPGQVPA